MRICRSLKNTLHVTYYTIANWFHHEGYVQMSKLVLHFRKDRYFDEKKFINIQRHFFLSISP